MEELWSGVEEIDGWLHTIWGDPLLEAIRERSYSRAYALLRRGEYPKGEQAAWTLLTEAVSATPHLFGTLLEALEDEIDLSIPRQYTSEEHKGISLVCRGKLMNVAAIAGSRENMKLLRQRGLNPTASRGSWVELHSTGFRIEDASPLAAAVLNGASEPFSWLMEQKGAADPADESLRCAVLFGLYYGKGQDSCACARRVLSYWGLNDEELEGTSFPGWQQAQCRMAPVKQLTKWFQEGVYGREVVVRYSQPLLSRWKREEKENQSFSTQSVDPCGLLSPLEDWKSFLLQLLRCCPELCRKTEVMEWLFRFEYSSEELELLSWCFGQRGEPVELGVSNLLQRLFLQPAPARKRLLRLFHDTCGARVVLSGESLMQMYALLQMLPELLQYVQIHNRPGAHSCSVLAGLLANYGQAAEFKKAIAAGYLEDEPLGPLLEELHDQDSPALIPLALTLLPHRDGLCEL